MNPQGWQPDYAAQNEARGNAIMYKVQLHREALSTVRLRRCCFGTCFMSSVISWVSQLGPCLAVEPHKLILQTGMSYIYSPSR
jgi:hypothetical protein